MFGIWLAIIRHANNGVFLWITFAVIHILSTETPNIAGDHSGYEAWAFGIRGMGIRDTRHGHSGYEAWAFGIRGMGIRDTRHGDKSYPQGVTFKKKCLAAMRKNANPLLIHL
ncbi:hypothetical protein CCP2SC5_1220006 [Azospirillaceae bacterium]